VHLVGFYYKKVCLTVCKHCKNIKCNCTMYIFGESVGTSPKPFVLRHQRSSYCGLCTVICETWRMLEVCLRSIRDDTRQLIHLLSVSGIWSITISLMWMATLSHRFHASTRCEYAVFCGIGLGDFGGCNSSWAANYSKRIHVMFRNSPGFRQLYYPKKWESSTGPFIRDTWPFKQYW
jgi:hypothetical protein